MGKTTRTNAALANGSTGRVKARQAGIHARCIVCDERADFLLSFEPEGWSRFGCHLCVECYDELGDMIQNSRDKRKGTPTSTPTGTRLAEVATALLEQASDDYRPRLKPYCDELLVLAQRITWLDKLMGATKTQEERED